MKVFFVVCFLQLHVRYSAIQIPRFIMIMKWYFKALKRHLMLIFLKCNTTWPSFYDQVTWESLKIKTAARVIDALTYYSLIYCITHIYCAVCVMFMMNQSARSSKVPALLNSGIETRHVHTGLWRRHILNKSLIILFYLSFLTVINLIKK